MTFCTNFEWWYYGDMVSPGHGAFFRAESAQQTWKATPKDRRIKTRNTSLEGFPAGLKKAHVEVRKRFLRKIFSAKFSGLLHIGCSK